ncbi:MAG: hypothetical protein J3K34DRAFT_72013 [Monoraphidium minutum]|nr:MAG: hypothetical protein J3K34DRAFT_72013 [Monoraphidium minutum]
MAEQSRRMRHRQRLVKPRMPSTSRAPPLPLHASAHPLNPLTPPHARYLFLRAAAWGDAHDMFKELASSLGSADAPLLVAGVPISNRDEYLVNPRLSRRFALDKLKDDDFPRFKLFLKGGDPKKPIEYSGGMKKGELSGWIVAHTSIFIGSRGQIEELDAAAKKFMAAKPKDRPAALKAAQAEAAKLELGPSQKEYAEYYIKAMQRVTDKGDSWPAQVQARARFANVWRRGGGGALGPGEGARLASAGGEEGGSRA